MSKGLAVAEPPARSFERRGESGSRRMFLGLIVHGDSDNIIGGQRARAVSLGIKNNRFILCLILRLILFQGE